jgi:23S rRNA (guanosine2251-2'-O)-methyltransferase
MTEWIYGRQVVRMALAAGARRRALRLAATASAARALRPGLPPDLACDVVDGDALEALTGSREHQGVALEVPAYPYADPHEVLGGALVVVLDEVSDPHNLGAVARSALAAGCTGLIVPRHRAAHVTPAAVKASAGTLEHLRVAQVANVARLLQDAKRAGFWVYGAASEGAADYTGLDLRGRVVLVFGAEGRGLRPLVARACDVLAAIPMRRPVESLNVSVAAALFLFEAVRQRDVEGGDDVRRSDDDEAGFRRPS